ncbi:MAG: hypothetical protein IIU65_03705 [Clostridia bacterium]|nr:hypothetical protein [Clostridia bacterium]
MKKRIFQSILVLFVLFNSYLSFEFTFIDGNTILYYNLFRLITNVFLLIFFVFLFMKGSGRYIFSLASVCATASFGLSFYNAIKDSFDVESLINIFSMASLVIGLVLTIVYAFKNFNNKILGLLSSVSLTIGGVLFVIYDVISAYNYNESFTHDPICNPEGIFNYASFIGDVVFNFLLEFGIVVPILIYCIYRSKKTANK